jgi:hypothetical protein
LTLDSAGKPFRTDPKIVAVVLVIVLAIAATITGLAFYHPLQASTEASPSFKISTTHPETGPAGSPERIQLAATGVNGYNSPASYTLRPAVGLSCRSPISSTLLTLGVSVDLDCTSNSMGVFRLDITVTSNGVSEISTVSFSFTRPLSVTISGNVQVTSNTPSDIRFANTTLHTAPLDAAHNYTITLPNMESYSVTVENGAGGSCSLGVLSLNQTSTAPLVENYQCTHLGYPSLTNLSCSPTSATVNFTSITCSASVGPSSSNSAKPSGQIIYSTSDSRYVLSSTSCSLTPEASQTISRCQTTFVVTSNLPNSQINGFTNITAYYIGDAVYSTSQASFQLAISPPPLTVTVSGTATTTGLLTHATGLRFVNTVTGTSYQALVKSDTGYTANLPNQQTYKVTLFYADNLGLQTGSCSAGALIVQQEQTVMTADFRC